MVSCRNGKWHMGPIVQLVLMMIIIMMMFILMLKILRLVLVVRLNEDDDGVHDDAPGLTGTAG